MSRRAPAPPPKGSSSTARTVVLVAVVAGIAALVLSRGFGGSTGSSGNTGAANGGSTKTTTKANGKGTTTVETTATLPATTVPPTIPAAQLKVVVLNGNGIKGTAGARTKELAALGYTAAAAKDAKEGKYEKSAVYFATADVKESANALAARMNLVAELLPADTSWVDPANIAGMQVIVLLGKDKASTPIVTAPAAAPTTTGGLTPKPAATTTTIKA